MTESRHQPACHSVDSFAGRCRDRRYVDTDTHVSAAQTGAQALVLVVVVDTCPVRNLIWEPRYKTAERSTRRQDSRRCVVVVDADDEVPACGVCVQWVIDYVDFTERPEVTDGRVGRCEHDVSAVRNNEVAATAVVLRSADAVEPVLRWDTRTAVQTGAALTVINGQFTAQSVPARGTKANPRTTRTTQRARTAVHTRVGRAVTQRCFAVRSAVAWVTLTGVHVDTWHTRAGVLTRVRIAIVDLHLTQGASVAGCAGADDGTNEILTSCTVQTRTARAVVDQCFAISSGISQRAITSVASLNIERTRSAVLTRIGRAVCYISLAIYARVADVTAARVAVIRVITSAAILTRITVALVKLCLAELAGGLCGALAQRTLVDLTRATVLTWCETTNRRVSAAMHDEVSVVVVLTPDPVGVGRERRQWDPRAACHHTVHTDLMSHRPIGVVESDLLPAG